MPKNAFVIHPALSQVARRSLVGANFTTTQYLSGRWVAVDSTGAFAVVGTARDLGNAYGLYFLLEGTHDHIGANVANVDFEVTGSTFVSLKATELPSNKIQGALAGAYGVFVGTVGPEGVNPADTGIVNGAELTVDAFGRLVAAGSGDIRVAVAEVVTRDGGGVASLTFRTTGN